MSFGAGKNCKVTLGATKVLGMGTVALTGVDTDLLDKTQFGDDWKQWEVGLKDGGELTFKAGEEGTTFTVCLPKIGG